MSFHPFSITATSSRAEGTWALVLEPAGARTRLVTRYRATYEQSSAMVVMVPVLAGVHAFIERKQLQTIKHRAETCAPSVPT